MAAPKGNKYAKNHGEGAPEKYTHQWLENEAQAFLEWMNFPTSLYFKSFALERGYSPQRLSEFAEKSEVFSEVLSRAKFWQESKLVNGALMRKYDCGMTKFVLANHHGWMEKSQISGDATNPLSIILERIDGKTKNVIDEE